MSLYEGLPRVEGATDKEREAMSFLKKLDIARSTGLTRYMVDKFMLGDDVPEFVRERIMEFVCARGKEFKKISPYEKKR